MVWMHLLDKSSRLRNWAGDEAYVKWQYHRQFKKPLCLDPPKTFNEKIQWLKLNWRKAIVTQCADKYEVRKFVEARVGGGVLKKIYGVWRRPEEIDFARLPDRFVLKINHGCRQQVICRDKAELDRPRCVKVLNYFLSQNRYHHGREWSYKNIDPKIFCEELVNTDSLLEYNFFCFNGRPKIVEAVADQLGDTLAEMFDLDWKSVGRKYVVASGFPNPVAKPAGFDRMLDYATKLSQGFPFVRVDFLDNGKIYFGEMTFYPLNGMIEFIPPSLDDYFGSLLELPEQI
ncbi:MAG TPA: ATP-grasp fold amidoligase family protein [Verrucomicrobiae bacterium]|nr:ATP-grasp fold amidoligase family protein [Verrucomicrobiae bacterium]